MRRVLLVVTTLFSIALLGALASPASAQTGDYGGGATLVCAPCTIFVGENTTVTGTGYLPNATVTLTIDGEFWTTVVTDDTGSFSLPFRADSRPADGFLTFVGTDGTNTLTTVVEVLDRSTTTTRPAASSGSLPRTGSDAGGLVRVAVVVLVLGAGLVLISRRTQRAS